MALLGTKGELEQTRDQNCNEDVSRELQPEETSAKAKDGRVARSGAGGVGAL